MLLHMVGYNADIPVIFKTMRRDRCVIWMKANGAEGFWFFYPFRPVEVF